jgi:hypothetical protein
MQYPAHRFRGAPAQSASHEYALRTAYVFSRWRRPRDNAPAWCRLTEEDENMRDLTSPELEQCSGGAFMGVIEPFDQPIPGPIYVPAPGSFDPIDPPIARPISIAVPESLDPVDPIDVDPIDLEKI